MTYDEGSRAATAPITKGGGTIAKAAWMPVSDADVEYRFRAFLYDKAGNITQVPDQNFVFDSSAGEYELFAVADPNSSTSVVPGFASGYIKYTAGMTINTNPVTFVYKIPKQNYRAYNKAGLSFGIYFMKIQDMYILNNPHQLEHHLQFIMDTSTVEVTLHIMLS